jgi:hypothetical protein
VKSRTTFYIDPDLLDKLESLIAGSGLSRDALLGKWLPSEIKLLRQMPPNSAEVNRYLKGATWSVDSARLNVALETQLLTQLNDVCKEKGVPRDLFLEAFIRFLLEGGGEMDWSPLGKIVAMLDDPRWEDDTPMGKYGPYAEALHIPEDKIAMVQKADRNLRKSVNELFGGKSAALESKKKGARKK